MGYIFKILLFSFIGYYIIKAIRGLFGVGISGQRAQANSRPTNDINIKKPRHSDDQKHVRGGEYVDFEDVD